MNLNSFQGYHVGNNLVEVLILQFVDDTLFVAKALSTNIMCLKTILRCFDLGSNPKVNFFKSKLIGIEVDNNSLLQFARLLNCKITKIPFVYLTILIGANSRNEKTWDPVIEKLKGKLALWKQRNISIGCRVTFINSILSSLPLFYASFVKAPPCMMKNVI